MISGGINKLEGLLSDAMVEEKEYKWGVISPLAWVSHRSDMNAIMTRINRHMKDLNKYVNSK